MTERGTQDICPDHEIDDVFCRQLHDPDYLGRFLHAMVSYREPPPIGEIGIEITGA